MARVEPLSSWTLSPTTTAASPADPLASETRPVAWPAIASLPSVAPLHPPLGPAAVPASRLKPSRRKSSVDPASLGQESVVVPLGNIAFTLAWLGIYTLHSICAAYLISAGYMYAALPTTQVANMLELYQLTLHRSQFQTIANFHYAVAAVHCYVVIKPVCYAIGSWLVPKSAGHRLSLLQSGISQRFSTFSIGSSSRTGSALLTAHSTLSWLLRRVYRTLLARDGFFGVHNQYFELMFLFREVVETALHSYQGYNMSRLLPHMRLNRFYTIILIVNCFTTPLLRRMFSKNRSLQRLLVVLCDIVLDFVSSIGVPVVVAASYIAQYDRELTDFVPWTVWYDDLWLLKFMNEAPLVLFGSWLDAASRLVFSIGLLSSMADVKSLIQRREVHSVGATPPTNNRRKSSTTVKRSSSVMSSRYSSALTLLLRKPEHQATLSKWVHRLLVLWGLAIAGVFLQAQLRSSAQYCGLELRPWLVQKPACGIVKIDCKILPEISGTTQQVDKIFDAIDAGSVEHVFFRHCAQVEIPDQFRNFHNLYGFKTYNSTIVAWAPEAAFTSQNHPRVRFAFFIMTQFPNGELPSGLLDPDFPQTLTDIEICGSNIRRLPESLAWPMTSTIYMELSQLQVFPLVLSRLKPFHLSLAFNQIHDFPAEAIMTPDIAIFTLRGNPIVELPLSGVDITQLRDTGTGVNLGVISMAQTNISTLPEWITEQFLAQVAFRASGSPICTDVLEQIDSLETQALLRERPWLSEVDCQDNGIQTNYPLEQDSAEG